MNFLANIPIRGAKLLFSVIRSIQTKPHIHNNAQLLQHFEGLDAQPWLARLSLINYIFEDETLQFDEIVGILKKLYEDNDPKILALNKLRSGQQLTENEMRAIQGN